MTDNKGFTGHEMLDDLDLIHMNGRIYDPFIARVMSADPMIQDPEHSQSYNRYAYVWNNPTNLTDPTGFGAIAAIGGRPGTDPLRQSICGGDPMCKMLRGEPASPAGLETCGNIVMCYFLASSASGTSSALSRTPIYVERDFDWFGVILEEVRRKKIKTEPSPRQCPSGIDCLLVNGKVRQGFSGLIICVADRAESHYGFYDPTLDNAMRAAGLKEERSLTIKPTPSAVSISFNWPIYKRYGFNFSYKIPRDSSSNSVYLGAGVLTGSTLNFSPRISDVGSLSAGSTTGWTAQVDVNRPILPLAGTFLGAKGQLTITEHGTSVSGGGALMSGTPSSSFTAGYTW